MSAEALREALSAIAAGRTLSAREAEGAFRHVMSGSAEESQIGAFLMGLHMRGEKESEIAAAVKVMRSAMLPVSAPNDAIDLCGTGGDMSGTLNISTAAAFVVAACGAPVAKHGNRALSSRSGSADLLAELGVDIALAPERISECIAETGLGFMFAPAHHPAARHVAPARKALGLRTIFNLVGPLCNPAGVKRQLLGVFAPEWLEPLARVLKTLGSARAWVVHGEDGLDEMTLAGKTRIAELHDGVIRSFTITPQDAGLEPKPSESLRGGAPQENAKAFLSLMEGEKGAYHDAVALNSAGALMVAGLAKNISEGVNMAKEALLDGSAKKTYEAFMRHAGKK